MFARIRAAQSVLRWTVQRSYASIPTKKKQEKVTSLLKYFKKTKRRKDLTDPTHPSNVSFLEICQFLKDYSRQTHANVTDADIHNPYEIVKAFLPFQRRHQVIPSVKVWGTTHTGDGLAIIPKSMYASEYADSESLFGKYTVLMIPKTTVGDKVKVLLKMHHEFYAEGELIEVLNKGKRESKRNNRMILCEHFQECNGCQLQMLSYPEQLLFKQNIIQTAYKLFYPNLRTDHELGAVNPSPLQYSYRTKLTPHFEVRDGKCTKLGFQHVNNRGKIDVEYCPIATVEINDKLGQARNNYLKGPPMKQLTLRQSIRVDNDTGEFYETALEGQSKVITEKIEDFIYQFDSNCFFQNNNSILPSLLDYIRYHMKQLPDSVENVVDTYCGVGFFGIALSNFHDNLKVFGIEISESSIKYANHNMKLNGLYPERTKFILGDASNIFGNEEFKKSGIEGKGSVVIVDPSRKGSDELFLKQLLQFEPDMIVYVSCNVFTQARDLANFEQLQGTNLKYKVDEVVGFDFFPQTKHVESVAILKKIDLCT
ncbi:hypothetical protein CANMA_002847 [Candida margitis]|uniref:uncharacterized protein n=1 Tax=Candida margitis TaxID=1775924 RepID=UPI00222738E8|nr:uncharacterized protein CANMA_002847 [Candida margitis]KAI5967667.1 hypothetical protein CANMA_002847 [Candida margitis]